MGGWYSNENESNRIMLSFFFFFSFVLRCLSTSTSSLWPSQLSHNQLAFAQHDYCKLMSQQGDFMTRLDQDAHPMYTRSILVLLHSRTVLRLSGECGAATSGSSVLTSILRRRGSIKHSVWFEVF